MVIINVIVITIIITRYVFNILAGYGEQFLKKTKRVPLTLARDRYPRPSSELLQSFLQLDDVTSLLIARCCMFNVYFLPPSLISSHPGIRLRDLSPPTRTRLLGLCLAASMTR